MQDVHATQSDFVAVRACDLGRPKRLATRRILKTRAATPPLLSPRPQPLLPQAPSSAIHHLSCSVNPRFRTFVVNPTSSTPPCITMAATSSLFTLSTISSLAAVQPVGSVQCPADSPSSVDRDTPGVRRNTHLWATRTDRYTGLPMEPPFIYIRIMPSPSSSTSSVITASSSSQKSINTVDLALVVTGGRLSDHPATKSVRHCTGVPAIWWC